MFPVSPPYGLWSYLIGYFTLPPREHKKIYPLKDYFFGQLREGGYQHIQGNKKQLVGQPINQWTSFKFFVTEQAVV